MVLHKNVVRRPSSIAGDGLHATADIAKGEVIWEAEANEKDFYFTLEQIRTWSEEDQRFFMNVAYQVAPGVYCGVPRGVTSPDDGEYMNHCCEPACGFAGDDRMVALVDIKAGDEVTYDYSTSETKDSFHVPFKCACGKPACRGTITGDDYKLPALRAKYAGHFTGMVQSQIDAEAGCDAAAAAATATAAR